MMNIYTYQNMMMFYVIQYMARFYTPASCVYRKHELAGEYEIINETTNIPFDDKPFRLHLRIR